MKTMFVVSAQHAEYNGGDVNRLLFIVGSKERAMEVVEILNGEADRYIGYGVFPALDKGFEKEVNISYYFSEVESM